MRDIFALAAVLALAGCSEGADGPTSDAGDAGCVALDGSHVVTLRQIGDQCGYICADNWSTCSAGSWCTTQLRTDDNCEGCGDRCYAPLRCIGSASSYACRLPR